MVNWANSFSTSVMYQLFPGKPTFTENDVGMLDGKVYIVTGANAGVGKELTRFLLQKNAKVYMACRSKAKCEAAIADIHSTLNNVSVGSLEYLHLDLNDLSTIKATVDDFLARETRLDVLFNNAGVMLPSNEVKGTVQGYDVQLGVNTIAPFLLTHLLTPILKTTAAADATPTRVVWVASLATDVFSGKLGVDMAKLGERDYLSRPKDPLELYGNSKAGMYLLSHEYARRHRDDLIISVACNPGNLDSDLYRNVGGKETGRDEPAKPKETGMSLFQKVNIKFFRSYLLYPSTYGAYTEMFCGFSPEVNIGMSGSWIGPWGRFLQVRSDIAHNAKPVSAGGLGGAEQFYEWTLKQVTPFM